MTNDEVSNHIKGLAINILSRSVNDVVFSEYCKEYSHSMAIYQTGIAAELLIKAKLILIDPKLVLKGYSDDEVIEIEKKSLIESKTIQYSELLKVLSGVIEIKGDYSKKFIRFGKLRNISLHFGYNDSITDASFEVLQFIFECLIPLMYEAEYFDENEFIDAMYLWDEVVISDCYLIDLLLKLKIKIPEKIKAELLKEKNED